MNRSISTILAAGLAALAPLAAADSYTMPASHPAGEAVVYPTPDYMFGEPGNAQPDRLCRAQGSFKRFTFDAHGFGGIRAVPHSRYATDIYGFEAELGFHVTRRQAFTLSLSFGSGGDHRTNLIETEKGAWPVSEDFERSDFNLLLGYRFTQPLGERTRISFGIKGGLDVQGLSYDDYWRKRYFEENPPDWDPDTGEYEYDPDYNYQERTWGFAYAASVMLEQKLTDSFSFILGYQYKGSTTEPDVPSVVPGGGVGDKARAMGWHEVHLGIRASF